MPRILSPGPSGPRRALYWWKGNVYSRIQGEKDRLLFAVHGMNFRTCKTFSDPKRGVGYRSVSREMLIYVDKDTGEVLKRWKNPWTGEEVDVPSDLLVEPGIVGGAEALVAEVQRRERQLAGELSPDRGLVLDGVGGEDTLFQLMVGVARLLKLWPGFAFSSLLLPSAPIV